MKKIIALLSVLLVLTGCAAATPKKVDIEIEHKLGKTALQTNPEKVVVFDNGIIDIMTYLELPVGGVPKDSLPTALKIYDKDEVLNAGTLFEPDFEKIMEYGPDLIIISGRASKQYEELSKIAPTVYMGNDTDPTGLLSSMDANIQLLGEIFPNKDVTKAMPALQEKVTELHDKAQASGLSTMFIMANGTEIKSFGPGSRYGHIFSEFGFAPIDHELDPSTHGATVSFELVSSLKPEIIIVMDRAAVTGGTVFAEELMNNDFVKGTPAAKNKRIIYVDPETWYITEGGYNAVLKMTEELLPLFN